MKVIIGAGPAGLYAAIKLWKAGVRDVVIFDPRAGNYTRPGHLNLSVFKKAEAGLGIKFWPGEEIGHIKDLERGLYNEARRLGILIENKPFIRLHQDASKPGVVIRNETGAEEIVPADYVFDCTGQRREVIAAVNRILPDSPLQLTTITELPVRNHFIAYVKINSTDWEHFKKASEDVDHISASTFARSIIKLRDLGWNELKFPRCYGAAFGKDKVCLYLHAPAHLGSEKFNSWVQTVLEAYASPIRFEHLATKPTKTKPRFVPFTMDAQALKEVSYKGRNLPTVVALGDAQIDFDYFLAHGILDGMNRIDALFEHMEIIDGKIYYFDAAEYLLTMEKELREHKKAVIRAATRVKQSFIDALGPAQLKLQQALALSKDPSEQLAITAVIKEIDARQSYMKAGLLFSLCHNGSNQIQVTPTKINSVISDLNKIQNDLIRALNGLSASLREEKSKTQEMLIHLALSWKDVGNALFKDRRASEAIVSYKKALEIYDLPCFERVHSSKKLPIYSNLAMVTLNERRYPEAIAAANAGLSIFEQWSGDSQAHAIREKIIINLTKAMCAQAQAVLLSRNHTEAFSLHSRAKDLVGSHKVLLSSSNFLILSKLIEELQRRLKPFAKKELEPESAVSLPIKSSETSRNHGLYHFSTFPIYKNTEHDELHRSFINNL